MNILFFLKPKSELAFVYDYHTLRQALEVMEHYKFTCIPILSKDGKYVGAITEGDLLWGIKDKDIINIHEAEDINIMDIHRKFDFKTVSCDSNMEDLVKKALDQNFVPVVDDENHFIGIITRRDIIDYCYKMMKENEEI